VNLEPRRNSAVWGILLEMDGRLLEALDRKTGHPNFYSRQDNRVQVRRVEDGRTVTAWLYLAKPNRSGRGDFRPTADYKTKLIEAASFWGFPSDYIDKMRAWRTE
jgi:gamma-glutamylcyclotransferase (GGCT)/AIG2-like uncharacterized protein YtfP